MPAIPCRRGCRSHDKRSIERNTVLTRFWLGERVRHIAREAAEQRTARLPAILLFHREHISAFASTDSITSDVEAWWRCGVRLSSQSRAELITDPAKLILLPIQAERVGVRDCIHVNNAEVPVGHIQDYLLRYGRDLDGNPAAK